MLEESFAQLLNQFAVPVKLNDETNTRKAIISSQNVSDSIPNFDDKTIHSNFKIQRGDIIHFNNVKYLIITDVQAKRTYEYKATMRPMTNTFEFTYTTEGEYHYDRLGNKVWDVEPKEVTEPVSCIAHQEGSPTIEGSQIRLPEERIEVIMPDDNASSQIKMDSKHTIKNSNYKVVNINLLQSGLRIFTMEWTTK
ncbi:hypothetical protein GCM10008983_06440 [Lentibacillus halophilus]|uniref:Uncharacterized protein n=1 Tax=Lentibacillus halophilus TaxID=295065 RepID=A0ABP3IYM5_9BACI